MRIEVARRPRWTSTSGACAASRGSVHRRGRHGASAGPTPATPTDAGRRRRRARQLPRRERAARAPPTRRRPTARGAGAGRRGAGRAGEGATAPGPTPAAPRPTRRPTPDADSDTDAGDARVQANRRTTADRCPEGGRHAIEPAHAVSLLQPAERIAVHRARDARARGRSDRSRGSRTNPRLHRRAELPPAPVDPARPRPPDRARATTTRCRRRAGRRARHRCT